MSRTAAVPASTAAYDVGYQSVPQFTREYRRMFGMPPARDAASARASLARRSHAPILATRSSFAVPQRLDDDRHCR